MNANFETMGAPFETARMETEPEYQATFTAAEKTYQAYNQPAKPFPVLPVAAGIVGLVAFMALKRKK